MVSAMGTGAMASGVVDSEHLALGHRIVTGLAELVSGSVHHDKDFVTYQS